MRVRIKSSASLYVPPGNVVDVVGFLIVFMFECITLSPGAGAMQWHVHPQFSPKSYNRLGYSLRACRGPVHQNVPGTAWKSKPSWYIVATNDRTVQPKLQRLVAKRMGATTYEVESSHVPMLSNPKLVIDVIRTAANA
jgi:pimeloyl-ACP methyl ester carboxylesterase